MTSPEYGLPIIISIEGNIGSGKSTIMKYLSSNFNNFVKSKNNNLKICYLQEPVSKWNSFTDKKGKNIIENYYNDQKKYAFQFQMMAYISRLSQFKEAIKQNYDIIFTERSMLTDRNVFAKMLYNDEKIEEIEYKIYNAWFDEFADCLQNMKIYYVKTDPEICHSRIEKRSRKGEESIPLSYLKSCSEYHNKWLDTFEKKIILNGNIDISENDYFNQVVNDIYLLVE
jgi:deoxyguanosine kinase